MQDLLAPSKPTEKTYKELIDLIKGHQEPAPSVIMERFHFNSCSQKADESITDFVARLRKLAKNCEYAHSLKDMLRDRLVCGCRDNRLQYKLLADPELTYEKAIQLAKSDETAERGTKDLTGGTMHKLHARHRKSSTSQPFRMPQPPAQPSTQPCFRCGSAHSPATCRFKSSTCNYCKKLGHIASVCRKKSRDQQQNGKQAFQLQADTSLEEEVELTYPMFYSSAPRRPAPIEVTVQLNNVHTQMEVDTGATLSVMSQRTYQSLWSHDRRPKLTGSSACLSTYTGEKIPVLGQIDVVVSYDAQKLTLPLQVVPTDGPTLMGRDWLEKLKLNWQEIHNVPTIE